MVIVGCSCDFLTVPAKEPTVIWTTSISNGGLIGGIFPNVFYNNSVLTLGVTNKRPNLFMVNSSDGKIRWEWSDFIDSTEYVRGWNHLLYQNTIIVNSSPKLYAIDLQTGKTLWKQQSDIAREGLSGIRSTFFVVNDHNQVLRGNVYNGHLEPVFTLPDSSGFIKFMTSPAPFIDAQSGDTLFVATPTYDTRSGSPNNKATFLLIYNISKRKTINNSLQLEGNDSSPFGNPTPFGEPLIINDKVYSAIGRSVQCNELTSGKLLWRKGLESSIWLGKIISVDGKIICNADGAQTMYALNPETGDILWQTKTSSASGNLFQMNGVVYMTGLGDGKLHAVDASTGKKLWELRSPDNKPTNGNSFFTETVTGDGQYIYVRSFLNLYCYKAAR
jgi:outer membrane protein assembly factor BamB